MKQIDRKDIAVSFSIEVGVTRGGQVFTQGHVLENVLGDVTHKQLVEGIAAFLRDAAEAIITHRLGEPQTEASQGVDDELVSFFDRVNTIEESNG